jgi:hypothetical protein
MSTNTIQESATDELEDDDTPCEHLTSAFYVHNGVNMEHCGTCGMTAKEQEDGTWIEHWL